MTQYFNQPPRCYQSRYARMLFDKAKKHGISDIRVDEQKVYIDGVEVETIVTTVFVWRYMGMLFIKDVETTVLKSPEQKQP